MSRFFHISIASMVGAAFLLDASSAFAGFGITPPYVRNDSLTHNSVYEQRIMLVRGNPDIDLRVELEKDVPGADNWISFSEGEEFILPAGENRVPFDVIVRVPDNAEYRDYTGIISLKTSPANPEDAARGVSIALGAVISVNITVSELQIREFEVRRVRLHDLNEGRHQWWLHYPGKIRFTMTIANTGNVPIAPTSVEFDIYDTRGDRLLEETKNTNKIQQVQPFGMDEVTAELPTFLPAGSYTARYRIYLDEEIRREGELTLSIRPEGTIEGDTGYGFSGLPLTAQATIVGPPSFLLLLLSGGFILWRIRKRKQIAFASSVSAPVAAPEPVFTSMAADPPAPASARKRRRTSARKSMS